MEAIKEMNRGKSVEMKKAAGNLVKITDLTNMIYTKQVTFLK